ncbi:helix-turn-helix domain-containing protein [Roseibium sp. TrichSKD4]|uniref:winged helix-turn-helix transcriptional regulator n=1 Tax=Roseibium sp. TrichSKD4 TaxID=744980 RepID=UPI000590DB7E|nr:helix-turn-helix domain-containing protein [Roseibium sp. TrichSKD4]
MRLTGRVVTTRLKMDKNYQIAAALACDAPCPIERGMRILGGKWTGSILWHLKDEPVRFNELARLIPGASKKIITERLKQLEAQGLVSRTVLDTSPISVEYQITEFGSTAVGFLDALRCWSENLPSAP